MLPERSSRLRTAGRPPLHRLMTIFKEQQRLERANHIGNGTGVFGKLSTQGVHPTSSGRALGRPSSEPLPKKSHGTRRKECT